MRCYPHTAKGFSLTELLVVVAILSFLAGIAVPAISRMNESAKESVARRNAQHAATVSAAANADGAYHVFPGDMDPGGVSMSLEVLRQGVVGEYTGIRFFANLSQEQITEASKYLDIAFNGKEYVLVYDKSGQP